MTKIERLLSDPEFISMAQANMPVAKIAEHYPDINRRTIYRAIDRIETPVMKEEHTFDGKRHSITTTEAQALDDLMNTLGIDQDLWEVKRVNAGRWDSYAKISDENGDRIEVVPLFKISTIIERSGRNTVLKNLLEGILKDIKKHSPVVKKKEYPPTHNKTMQMISLFDMHFGKMAWHEETGEEYNTDIAAEIFDKAIDYHIKYGAVYEPSVYLLPIGNDFFNIDNSRNMTTSGTPQDVDMRWKQVFRKGRESVVRAIDKLSQHAKVHVVVVPGNHDTEASWWLGETLMSWYHNNDNVYIDNSARERKVFRYGDNAIGFLHGHKGKIKEYPMAFATAFREEWASAKHREIVHGHYHKYTEMLTTPISEEYGVRIRCIPSLSASDAWHDKMGYTAKRTGLSIIYDYHDGAVATLSYNEH